MTMSCAGFWVLNGHSSKLKRTIEGKETYHKQISIIFSYQHQSSITQYSIVVVGVSSSFAMSSSNHTRWKSITNIRISRAINPTTIENAMMTYLRLFLTAPKSLYWPEEFAIGTTTKRESKEIFVRSIVQKIPV